MELNRKLKRGDKIANIIIGGMLLALLAWSAYNIFTDSWPPPTHINREIGVVPKDSVLIYIYLHDTILVIKEKYIIAEPNIWIMADSITYQLINPNLELE